MNDSVRPYQSPNRLNLKIKNYRWNVRKLVKIPDLHHLPPSCLSHHPFFSIFWKMKLSSISMFNCWTRKPVVKVLLSSCAALVANLSRTDNNACPGYLYIPLTKQHSRFSEQTSMWPSLNLNLSTLQTSFTKCDKYLKLLPGYCLMDKELLSTPTFPEFTIPIFF